MPQNVSQNQGVPAFIDVVRWSEVVSEVCFPEKFSNLSEPAMRLPTPDKGMSLLIHPYVDLRAVHSSVDSRYYIKGKVRALNLGCSFLPAPENADSASLLFGKCLKWYSARKDVCSLFQQEGKDVRLDLVPCHGLKGGTYQCGSSREYGWEFHYPGPYTCSYHVGRFLPRLIETLAVAWCCTTYFTSNSGLAQGVAEQIRQLLDTANRGEGSYSQELERKARSLLATLAKIEESSD